MNSRSFTDYGNAVAAMQKHFGLDTGSAHIRLEVIADGFEGDWSPEKFAFGCDENNRVTMLCELGV
jgi:hypothetical protein